MKNFNLLLTLIVLFIFSNLSFAQEKALQKATKFGMLQGPIIVPSIAQQIKDGTFIAADPKSGQKMGPEKRRGANKTVPGKGLPKGNDPLVQNQMQANTFSGKEPLLVFDANISDHTPSDPTGAVGPNHFVAAWNTGFRVFSKDGTPLTDAALLSTLFPGNNSGDPIVFYDAQADRFVITEFDHSPNGFNMAVCQGSDPVNDGWYIYTTGFETGIFPDYTKFAVWSDGYYVTANIDAAEKVFAVEREEMLNGNAAQFVGFPLTGITTSGFYSPHFFSVTNSELPATGNATVAYLQDDAWDNVNSDHIKLWTVNVDWENIGSSSISQPLELATAPFISVFDGGSFVNVPQPSGPDQDVLQATIMNQAQFRKFPTHNSAIFNFVVDTDGSDDELAGVRWFELRQDDDGAPWSIYQEGTYISPYDNKHAFSGSMVMDGFGNIGMGYTTCNENHKIAINYTGRYATDPLGQMTVDETLIAQSTSNNPSNRLADYVQLSVDPVNDKTFWHIAEYFVNNERTDVVGVFQIAFDFVNDVAATNINQPNNGDLTANESITITVSNYGENEQSDIPVNYQVDNGAVVSETMTGILLSGESAQYTFVATTDLSVVGQTYQIKAFTSMANDEFLDNDTVTKNVMHLFPNDIGVAAITSPTSGSGLSNDEEITVSIRNFGTGEQSNFEVSYNLEGNIVTEDVSEPLPPDTAILFTFSQSGDFSNIGPYTLSAYTTLLGDAVNSNDTTNTIIENKICQPEADCSYGDGLYLFNLRTINNATDCSENGYGDYLDMMVELETQETYPLTVTAHYGSQNIKLWIDFNDNFLFEYDELLIEDWVIATGQVGGEYTESTNIEIPSDANLGEHLMRAKSNWNSAVPYDACESTSYGETEDYMANIILYTGMENIPLANSEMIVKSFANNQFEISLQSNKVSGDLIINIHNVLGQKLVENRVKKINDLYFYSLDMSFAEPGAYIIRLGNSKYGKVKRIIVK